MKPEDFKPQHSKEERLIYIQDRVWLIPPDRLPAGNTFEFPGWNSPLLFGNDNPIAIEYCSGNGTWIAEKAKAHPEINWVAVEMRFDRVKKNWSKIKNHSLSNMIVIFGEAYQATSKYFPSNSVESVYINFPDPWPKSKHAKNRLIQDPFTEELRRILKDKGTLTFVTDDEPYSAWFIEVMLRTKGFISTYPSPYFTAEYSNYGTSFFEELWRSKGQQIRYHEFVRS
jgi:tRNA (guanine-N7-)-methyltransferase